MYGASLREKIPDPLLTWIEKVRRKSMKTVPPNKPAFQATPRRELLDDPIHDPYQD